MDYQGVINDINSFKDKYLGIMSNDIAEGLQTSTIKEKVKDYIFDYYNPLISSLENVANIADSEINIALLGRYSHGKSALVNALFNIRQEEAMPTGEGIVTSKATRVVFSDSATKPEAIACLFDGSEKKIDIPSWQNSVNSNVDSSDVIHYKMVLPTNKRPFASQFASKKINLIDLPGVGGVYFTDFLETSEVLRVASIVLVVIKITEIPVAGVALNSLLQDSDALFIPVLTYLDKWKSCDYFADCTNEDEMMNKARKMILDDPHFSRIHSSVTGLIAVSSLPGQECNIDNLRSQITRFVTENRSVIEKKNIEPAAVVQQKNERLKESFKSLLVSSTSAVSNFEKLVKDITPENEDKVDITAVFDKPKVRNLIKHTNTECDHQIKNVKSDIKKFIRQVKEKQINELYDFLDTSLPEYIEKKNEEINNNLPFYFNELKQNILIELASFVKKQNLEHLALSDVIKRLKEEFENVEIDLDDVITADFSSVISEYEKYRTSDFIIALANKIPLVTINGKSQAQIKQELYNLAISCLDETVWMSKCRDAFSDGVNSLIENASDCFYEASDLNEDIAELIKKERAIMQVENELKKFVKDTIYAF